MDSRTSYAVARYTAQRYRNDPNGTKDAWVAILKQHYRYRDRNVWSDHKPLKLARWVAMAGYLNDEIELYKFWEFGSTWAEYYECVLIEMIGGPLYRMSPSQIHRAVTDVDGVPVLVAPANSVYARITETNGLEIATVYPDDTTMRWVPATESVKAVIR
jgi:hypothetical protein